MSEDNKQTENKTGNPIDTSQKKEEKSDGKFAAIED